MHQLDYAASRIIPFVLMELIRKFFRGYGAPPNGEKPEEQQLQEENLDKIKKEVKKTYKKNEFKEEDEDESDGPKVQEVGSDDLD